MADQSFICPRFRPYYLSVTWYFVKDTIPHLTDENDKKRMSEFFKSMEEVRDIINNFVNNDYPHNDIDVILKSEKDLHLTFEYINCQKQSNIQIIDTNKMDIFGNNDRYKDIFNEFGYNSWDDVVIGFDKILCINDHANGDITYDLFLDQKSQNLMKQLIERSEEIIEKEYNINLIMHRIKDQQAFHVTIGTIYIKENDYNDFDSKLLMDTLNHKMYAKFPSIKLANYPQTKAFMKYNTLTLNDKYQFKMSIKDIY